MFKQVKKGLILGSWALLASPLGVAGANIHSDLAEIWVVDVPFQQSAVFEQVLNDYINQRKSAGDSASWELYKSQASSHLDSYLIRHCCFKKAERAKFESWLNSNELHKDWSLNEQLNVADFEYFFAPTDVSELVAGDGESKKQVAVSQFTLQEGSPVRGSSQRIQQNSKDMPWGLDWAWTFEGYSKGLLNLKFDSFESQELAEGASQFDLEQLVNDLQFNPDLKLTQSRYLVYSYLGKL
ncbi:MAG: hypothetical protein HWE16_04715 [Gammaproteobacteria bacterium]|nr:hypothetical protein [Gammaproteobacteria bacterium]